MPDELTAVFRYAYGFSKVTDAGELRRHDAAPVRSRRRCRSTIIGSGAPQLPSLSKALLAAVPIVAIVAGRCASACSRTGRGGRGDPARARPARRSAIFIDYCAGHAPGRASPSRRPQFDLARRAQGPLSAAGLHPLRRRAPGRRPWPTRAPRSATSSAAQTGPTMSTRPDPEARRDPQPFSGRHGMTALDLADIQGGILRAYGRQGFPKARYFFLTIRDAGEGPRVRRDAAAADHAPPRAGRIPSAGRAAAAHPQPARQGHRPRRGRARLSGRGAAHQAQGGAQHRLHLPRSRSRSRCRRGRCARCPTSLSTAWRSARPDPRRRPVSSTSATRCGAIRRGDNRVHILVSMNAEMNQDGTPIAELEDETRWLAGALRRIARAASCCSPAPGPTTHRYQEMSAVLRDEPRRDVADQQGAFRPVRRLRRPGVRRSVVRRGRAAAHDRRRQAPARSELGAARHRRVPARLSRRGAGNPRRGDADRVQPQRHLHGLSQAARECRQLRHLHRRGRAPATRVAFGVPQDEARGDGEGQAGRPVAATACR